MPFSGKMVWIGPWVTSPASKYKAEELRLAGWFDSPFIKRNVPAGMVVRGGIAYAALIE
jgi:hypothetical protein